MMILIFRIGTTIPVPGVDTSIISKLVSGNSLLALYNYSAISVTSTKWATFAIIPLIWALSSLKTAEDVARLRGKKVEDLLG